MKTTNNDHLKQITAAAVCLALCLVLPFLTGQIPQIGSALSPMHIPVLLGGFICGPWYAAAVGLLAPLLRFMMFGMPPLMPTGVSMTFELAAYGLSAGFLYNIFPKKTAFIYAALIIAMFIGRVVWGVNRVLLIGVAGVDFSWQMFIAGAFINAVPGIIVHIALVPVIVVALKKVGFLNA